MKQIPEKEYERLLLLELDNEKLKSENRFLHKKVAENKIVLAGVKNEQLQFWSTIKIADAKELGMRAKNVLSDMDIVTMADLIYFCMHNSGGAHALKKQRNLGETCFNEIKDYLEVNGLYYY